MFYYTQELAESDEFRNDANNLNELFEELIHKTNLGYENSNISIKAFKHCFEMATMRENISNNMSVILDEFKKMKESPEQVRQSADVAVLLIYDVEDLKDSCGMGFQDAYKTGETFSVASRHCAFSQLTLSHEIAHNFGANHTLGHLLNKSITHKGHEFYYRTIMKPQKGVPSNRTNYYSNPYIFHPITKTRTGKFGVPSNYIQFFKHIEKIAALGDESCKCNIENQLNVTMMPYEKCSFKSIGKPAKQYIFDKKKDIQKRNDIWDQSPLLKQNLYKKFLTDVQNLYQKYLKDDQRLYKKYLNEVYENFLETL